ncbi:response regulator transcription factor [Cohnella hongkongensis]|uniref:Response regulator n=1 Tax=Cohnella hongkongensis TaxID=178337 RepID=A0ABV9F6I4_9BACL
MYRVAIVDDEPVIRFGIKASVDWARENVGLVGDFANGEEAWRALESEPVDILITDIKMPVMDGLELTRRTLGRHPRTKVIFVSSYNDFEYVRQGLKLGVVDYLLKPTLEPEGLLELVRKCLRQIEEERRHDLDRQLIRISKRSFDRKRLESDVKRALAHDDGGLSAEAVPEWMKRGYAICTVLIDGLRETEERFGQLHSAILLEEMQSVFYETAEEGAAFLVGTRMLVLLVAAGDGGSPPSFLRGVAEKWRGRLGVTVTIGYAHGGGVEELRGVFGASGRAAERRFYEGSGQYAASEAALPSADRPSGLPSAGQLLQELKACAHARDAEAADKVVRRWIGRWTALRPDPDAVRKEALEIVTALFVNEQEMTVLLEGFEELKRSETIAELTALLHAQIKGYRKSYAAGSHTYRGNKQLIDKAIAYISRHYTGEITLQQLADYVHMSKNYFCLQFKHHTGLNFIDYLIRLRIGKAKELLRDTELKIYEVAGRAGFNDVKYFSKLFKKTTGASPVEYRERRLSRE